MSEELRHGALAFFHSFIVRKRVIFGTAIFGILVLLFAGILVLFQINVPEARADDVTTSVTVLNTPPTWTVYARESPESSTTTPTNAGSTVTWIATATDSNAESYYLIICKTSGSPTANAGAAPSCNGGLANRWAVSSLTASGVQASVSTTTKETFPFANELNDWFAWICDANASLPRCNTSYSQGSEPGNGFGHATSPFVVNHPPHFTLISNDTPANPGETMTWTATAFDLDTQATNDTVQLFVCKANDFTGVYCGSGGSWATSTLAASNPATTTTIQIPTQDKLYDAYVFILDNHGLAATSSTQGTNSTFTVSNVTPTLSGGTIFVNNSSNMTINVPSATSGPFTVNFTVTDNNSCLNSSSGNELNYAITNVYRSGVASTSCIDASHYNSNNCYVATSSYFRNFLTCSQDTGGGNCAGASDPDVTWTCRYSLWYNADPTDLAATTTPWTAENWLASVRIQDDNSASSTWTEAAAGVEVIAFMAFNVTQTSIQYSSLEPGFQNDPIASTTDLIAIGNVGLDEDLYGDTMCTNWTAADSCDSGGIDATSEIPVANQRFATSGVAYASAFPLTGSTSPAQLLIHVLKTTVTSTPETKNTFWGIGIPGTITLAGNYTGQNTITAKVSNFLFWQ